MFHSVTINPSDAATVCHKYPCDAATVCHNYPCGAETVCHKYPCDAAITVCVHTESQLGQYQYGNYGTMSQNGFITSHIFKSIAFSYNSINGSGSIFIKLSVQYNSSILVKLYEFK